jgi:hypothetical protein
MPLTTPLNPVARPGPAGSARLTRVAQDLAQPTPRYPASTGRVLLLVFTAFLVLTQLYAAIPLAGPVGDHLGGEVTFALSTVYGLCYAAGFLFWGPIADRYGNKRIMVVGLGVLTALTIACAFAASIPMLTVLRGLQGFAAASFPPAALAYLAVATPPRFRVAMYTGLGPHLSTLGLAPSQAMLLRLVGLPGMFAALLVGPLARRLSLAAIARLGVVVGALGLLIEALLASTLIGTATASLIFVTGISLAVSAMISLFGEAAAPHRAGGMALNGFVLFLGASLGPLTAAIGLSFAALLTALATLLVIAAICITGYATLQARASP